MSSEKNKINRSVYSANSKALDKEETSKNVKSPNLNLRQKDKFSNFSKLPSI
jgi:hypothetical protein